MGERLARLAHLLLLLAVAAMLGFLSTRFGFRADWSYAQSASLGPESLAILAKLDAPVEVTSYARRPGELRALVSDFVARYRRVKPDLSLRFVDPDADPAAMREAGITTDGELEVRYDGRSERLKLLNEAEFSAVLLRLSRPRQRIVAFLEGEGERDPLGQANADLGRFAATLGARGLRVVPLPLARTGKVPENTDLVVIANPRVALPDSVRDALLGYLDRGGALLWLAEPGEPGLAAGGGLDALADALGLRVLPGVVVDASGQAYGIGDPSFVALSEYPPHAITRDFALTLLLPQPAALAKLTGARWALAPLLRSGPSSWNETGHIPQASEATDTIRQDAEEGELAGPLDLGFALSRVSPRPDRREQRVVVLGDGDFLSNSFLGNGGNREFGQRVFDWLLGDDAQIEVPDRSAPDRELKLSQAGLTALALTFLVVLPLLLAGSGWFLWWLRRRR